MNIPGFELLEKLGESAMTELWMARQVTLDRIAAIRILKPGCAADERTVNSFVREARLPVKIRHANVPEIYDVSHCGDVHYVVMEHVTGTRLAELVQRDGPMLPKRALGIARDVAAALDAAWKQAALTHGNINPSCIRIDETGAAKVLDLGFMHVGDPAGIRLAQPDGLPPGIPNYLAPEQAEQATAPSPRTDMYGLGATLFHLTTGRVPFAGDSPWSILGKQRADQLPNPRDVNPKVTPGLANLITHLMMKDPKQRPADWGAVVKSIDGLLAGRFTIQPLAGMSTIAPAQYRQAAPGGKSARRTGPGAAVRGLAWLVLLALWAAIIVWRWKEAGRAEGEQPGAAPSGGSAVRSSADSTPGGGAAAAAGGNEARAPGESAFDGFLQILSTAVLEGRVAEAMGMVYAARTAPEAGSYRAALPGLEQFLAEIGRMESLLEAAFREKVGQTILVTHNGREYQLLLQATAGGRVRGLVGDEPVVFEISQLNPLELSHWLGPPGTAAECAMKAILHLRGNDIKGAIVFAGRSGPLSEAMRKILMAREKKTDAVP